ncbi:uncharacterized protein L3040_000240 [Drepanopeziza brunnea f. sp. 'multigermtubi']|uniref:uncharacterized protein n=1 Tax=Drepanopeziza brunnea f. sp. 'multigermtubi' TaxID=698441 RepID=UPI0023A4AB97|nr:hypothetical protein L3040_000240 [Drepanopeziza brunnea f. sp. 'multigermtubi']
MRNLHGVFWLAIWATPTAGWRLCLDRPKAVETSRSAPSLPVLLPKQTPPPEPRPPPNNNNQHALQRSPDTYHPPSACKSATDTYVRTPSIPTGHRRALYIHPRDDLQKQP